MTDTPISQRRLPLLAEGRRAPDPAPNLGAPANHAAAGDSTSFIGLAILITGLLALGVFVSWGWTLVILCLVFMIFMHELGHYLTARWTGMKVVEFFIGFGPRLWSFRLGETTFGVKGIPAGAYVRIIGMNNLDVVAPQDENRTYRVKSFPRKLLVVSAGSTMHFLMAIVLLFVVFSLNGKLSVDDPWSVARVSPLSTANVIGVQPGDEIVSVDGVEIGSFEQLGDVVRTRGGQEVEVVLRRAEQTLSETAVLGYRLSAAGEKAFIGLSEDNPGLLAGDRILAVDGVKVSSWDDVLEVIDGRLGEPLTFIVLPAARPDELLVVEETVVDHLPSRGVATTGFLGVGPQFSLERFGVLGSVREAIVGFGSYTKMFMVAMSHLVTGGGLQNFVTDTVTGDFGATQEPAPTATGEDARASADRGAATSDADPDRIISIYGAARVGEQLADDSFHRLLSFLAILNISIGLINLLPLPPLDGGHVAVAVYERLRSFGGRRHQVDYAKVLPVAYGALVLLLAIGLLAVFRDIADPLNVQRNG